jgi:hypothetical protein
MVVAAQLFLEHTKYLEFETEVPAERWFRSQRKGLGYEAWLYAMIRVAKCNAVLQWGFDETSLDGTPYPNLDPKLNFCFHWLISTLSSTLIP